MGYTHYFYRPPVLDPKRFRSAVEDCIKLCEALPIQLCGFEGEGDPIFEADEVCFNGCISTGGASEPFQIERVSTRPSRRSDGLRLGYCKTNSLPYNLAVQCCLIVFKHYFSDQFRITSDGSDEQWNEAANDCNAMLGYGLDFELDIKTIE